LKLWEILEAIEGGAEANKRMAGVVARDRSEREAARKGGKGRSSASQQTQHPREEKAEVDEFRKIEKSAKLSKGSSVLASAVGGNSGSAGESGVRMEKSEESNAQSPSSDRSSSKGRLVSLEEAVSLRGIETGEILYLSGRFVVTASGRDRAVLRPVQGGAASLSTRIIAEYAAGATPPAQGATFLQNSLGRFEIRDVRRWSPLQRPPSGEAEIFVKD
jgi:hypothetical protein